jgi:hypothetical protein
MRACLDGGSRLRACHGGAPKARRRVPDNVKELNPRERVAPKPPERRRRTEYPANGSFDLPPNHAALLHDTREPKLTSVRNYGQASRLISIGKLNVSPRLHTRPITWSSSRSLQGSCDPGRSHLVEGFTLRCIQRFSLPDVATRRCRWRDNRYTRGPSNPVLSY